MMVSRVKVSRGKTRSVETNGVRGKEHNARTIINLTCAACAIKRRDRNVRVMALALWQRDIGGDDGKATWRANNGIAKTDVKKKVLCSGGA